ncbi:MAG: hypothetical protein AAF633_28065, partial [Chloroflexota bacterium]
IQADQEAKSVRSRKKKGTTKVNHYIKSIASVTEALLNNADITTLVSPTGLDAPEIKSGDRFIYYSVASKIFFAVATITGDPKSAKAADYADIPFGTKKINLFPIDIDAFAATMEQTVNLDSVELESQPKFKDLLNDAQTYLKLSEDDFELLAELLTEYVEDDEDDTVGVEAESDDLDDENLLIEDDGLDI